MPLSAETEELPQCSKKAARLSFLSLHQRSSPVMKCKAYTCQRKLTFALCHHQPFTRITGTSSGRQCLKLFGITPKYPIHQGNSVWCLRALHTCNYLNPQNCTHRYLQAQKCWHKIRGHFLKPVPRFWWYTIWGVVILKWMCGKQLKISRHPICV